MNLNANDFWDVLLADEFPAELTGASTDEIEFFYTPVWLPSAVALSALAFGAGIEFGAAPALSADAVADYVAATTHTLKNVNGVVSNSPLSGSTNPLGGQAFWLYIHDTSAFTGAARIARRIGARQAALSSVK